MLCVAQKEFKGNGEIIVRDQLVDASQFRNASVLISQRYLRPATEDEINSAYFADDMEHAPIQKSTGLKARRAKKRSH